MPTKSPTAATPITMRAIRKYAKAIAERFHPEAIYLFGSYAYGEPHADSDVDLMVIMPAANALNKSVRIPATVPAPFPIDVMVCRPDRWERRHEDRDMFLIGIATRGKRLYDASNTALGEKGRGRLPNRPKANRNFVGWARRLCGVPTSS